MQGQSLLLARHYSERSDRVHNGKIVTIRSNLRPHLGRFALQIACPLPRLCMFTCTRGGQRAGDGFAPLGTSLCDAPRGGGSGQRLTLHR